MLADFCVVFSKENFHRLTRLRLNVDLPHPTLKEYQFQVSKAAHKPEPSEYYKSLRQAALGSCTLPLRFTSANMGSLH